MRFLMCFILLSDVYVQGLFDPTEHPNWHLVNDKQCGLQPALRIIGGQDARIGEFPWMVLVLIDKIDSATGLISKNHFCGGSIISQKYVLTAAHCFGDLTHSPVNIRIIVGDYDRSSDPDCDANNVCAPNAIQYHASEFVIHHEYNLAIGKHYNPQADIALARVDSGFIFTDFMLPICLEYGDLLNENYAGEIAETIGWGVYRSVDNRNENPNILQKVSLVVLDEANCTLVLSTLRLFQYFIPETHICAGTQTQFAYFGDSGSPMFIAKSVNGDIPRQFQIGVFVQSFDNDKSWFGERRPHTYTRVSSFLPWILDHIRD